MKNLITVLTVGSMVFTGSLSALAQEGAQGAEATAEKSGNYNQNATELFLSRAKDDQITPETLKKFKEKNANINVMYKNSEGVQTNLFLESCCFPDITKIRECNDGSFNFQQDYLNRMNVLTTLVELGADTSVKDENGRNAITIAILKIANDKFREGIVMYLHNTAHVEINNVDNKGGTPLLYALVVSRDIIYTSEDGGVPPIISFLVEKKADVNAADLSGITALMYAAKFNTLETVKYLIAHGAKISSKDKNGKTALDYAKTRSGQKIAKYLEEKMLDNL